VEAGALPGDQAAVAAACSEILAQYKEQMDKGIIPVPELMGLVQEHAGEIKDDGGEFIGALRDLEEKAKELADPRRKGKVRYSLACMAAVATAAIFRGCRTFAGFASFAKANGAWLNLCGARCETCAAACRRTLSRIDSNELLEELGGFFAERAGAALAACGFSAGENEGVRGKIC
jgi:hypothetical protein